MDFCDRDMTICDWLWCDHSPQTDTRDDQGWISQSSWRDVTILSQNVMWPNPIAIPAATKTSGRERATHIHKCKQHGLYACVPVLHAHARLSLVYVVRPSVCLIEVWSVFDVSSLWRMIRPNRSHRLHIVWPLQPTFFVSQPQNSILLYKQQKWEILQQVW